MKKILGLILCLCLFVSGCATGLTAYEKRKYVEKLNRSETIVKKRYRYIERQPELGEDFKTLIKKGRVKLGMTKKDVIASWGKPKDINKTVGSWGVHEEWVYSGSYLYFEDGILTSWQD